MQLALILLFLTQSLYAQAAFDPNRVLVRTLSQEDVYRAQMAAAASLADYSLPTLSQFTNEQEYVKTYAEFAGQMHSDYEVFAADADLSSGLKFVIYRPSAGASKPWILSFTGTEGVTDWLNNTGLGKQQFQGVRKVVELFSTQLLPDEELIVTGHSPGGAIAQAAAHEIRRLRNERGLIRKPLTLITWNAFGAETLIQRVSRFHPQLAAQMTIRNFFVRGDVVSQIGRHFGQTFELVAEERNPKYENRPDGVSENLEEIVRLHSMDTVKALSASADNLKNAKEITPPYHRQINHMAKVSWVLSAFNRRIHEYRQLWTVRWIHDLLLAVQYKDLENPLKRAAYQYVYNVGHTETFRLREEMHRDKAHDLWKLDKVLGRFRIMKERMGI